MQSPPGPRHTRISLGSCTPGPAPGLGSAETLVKGRTWERCLSRTLGDREPRLPPLPCTRGAGARVGLGAQVRGGATEDENRSAPRSPGSRARRSERRARAGGRGRSVGTGGRGGGSRSPRAAHSPGLWSPAAGAGAGFLPEPRSFFLPFPLPLPSLRSDISPKKCTLYAEGCGRRPRATSLVQGLESGLGKFVAREGERRAAALVQRGGRLLSPAGSGTDAACGPGHLGLAIPWSGGLPGSRGCSWRPGKSAVPAALGPAAVGAVLASVRSACSPKRERRSLSCPRSHRPGSRHRSAPALARARSSDKFWGTPRRLFFNCPTATHLPPAGWRLAPPSHPPLPSPPPSSLPHPHPKARTRHREEPGLVAPGRSPFLSPSPDGRAGGRGAAARPADAGNPR